MIRKLCVFWRINIPQDVKQIGDRKQRKISILFLFFGELNWENRWYCVTWKIRISIAVFFMFFHCMRFDSFYKWVLKMRKQNEWSKLIAMKIQFVSGTHILLETQLAQYKSCCIITRDLKSCHFKVDIVVFKRMKKETHNKRTKNKIIK